jgi:DNA-binding MarR family transcriptional regulator
MAYAPLGRSMRTAHYAFRQVLEGALRPTGMSLPLAGILVRLDEEDGLSSAELARREGVTAQTVNHLVGRLLDLGLVERRQHQTHGRILTVHLTRAGRRTLGVCLRAGDAVEKQMLSDFTPEQRRQLLSGLRRCARALGAIAHD